MRTSSELLTPEEVAEEYPFACKGTLANWRNRGWPNLPFVKISRKIFYKRSDVESFIAKHTFGRPDNDQAAP